MNERDPLRLAFPDHAPQDYHDALLDALRHLPPRPQKRRVSRKALLIAAILLLLMMAWAAVANKVLVQSQVLQNTMGADAHVPKAMESGAVKVSLTIDEYMFDNGGFQALWSVTSKEDRPLFYSNSYSYEGMPSAIGGGVSSDNGDATLVMLNGQVGRLKVPDSNQSTMSILWGDKKPDKPFTFTITVYVFETDMTPVLVDEMGGELSYFTPIPPEEMEERNMIPVGQKGIASLCNNSKFNDTHDRLMEEAGYPEYGSPEEHRIYHRDAFVESGLMKPVTTLTASVIIDPSLVDMRPLATYRGPKTFDLGDCMLDINYINLYALNLDYDIRLYFKEPVELPGEDRKFLTPEGEECYQVFSDWPPYHDMILCDEQYRRINFGSSYLLRDDEGQPYYRFYNAAEPEFLPQTLYMVIHQDRHRWPIHEPEKIKALMDSGLWDVIELPLEYREDMKLEG